MSIFVKKYENEILIALAILCLGLFYKASLGTALAIVFVSALTNRYLAFRSVSPFKNPENWEWQKFLLRLLCAFSGMGMLLYVAIARDAVGVWAIWALAYWGEREIHKPRGQSTL